MKFIKLVIIFIILTSCKSNVNKKVSAALDISTFSQIPTEIKNCRSLISETNQQLKNEKYIFIAGYDSIAFISIDNKVQKLKVKKYIHKPNTPNNEDSVNEFYNNDIKVVVHTYIDWEKIKKEKVEGWWINGFLIVENKTGKKTKVNFVGKSGCEKKPNT